MVFTRQKNSSYGYFLLIFKAGSGSAFLKQLDPDPHSEKLLNSDAQKMNADPQPGLCGSKYFIFESGSRNLPQFGAGSERFSRLHYQL